ncbi:unnamed protein product [Prunus armeniaca]
MGKRLSDFEERSEREGRFSVALLRQCRRFSAKELKAEAISGDFQPPYKQGMRMSDIELDYSDSPRAFEGESKSESSTVGLESLDFVEVGDAEVSTESGSTSSVEVLEVNGTQPSTSGHRVEATKASVSVAHPGEGVLTVVTRRQRVPMAKQKGLVFKVDFLEPNSLNKTELAKIRPEFHISESVMMRIPGPLESLSNPDGEVVFFTDAFKHGLRLRGRRVPIRGDGCSRIVFRQGRGGTSWLGCRAPRRHGIGVVFWCLEPGNHHHV